MPSNSKPPDPDEPSQGGWSSPGLLGVDGPAAEPPRGARYVVGALLGRGGMGAVHAARDTTLGRDVALKELQPELAGNPAAAARLAREAAITGGLDHPGIVAVHDRGRLPDGRPFYTMRLVRGGTLARAAAEGMTPDSRRTLVRHVLAAAEAVAAAHDAGVVHRDLKPQNILIGAHGETQVVDWGLATPTAAAAARWPDLPPGETRGAVGTPPYTSPEQAAGEPADPRHDVWSLGVTLGKVVGGDLPPELQAIYARATAPLGERYPDAAAFADDLLRWFEGRRVSAHTYSAGELLRRTMSAYRLPLGIGAAGLLAVSVAVAGGWWQTTRSLGRALGAEAAALANEREARASLADLRLERAVAATRAGARETAETLAIAVLLQREDPLARGVFAAFGRAERPALVKDEDGPKCTWSALPAGEAGTWVLCGTADGITRWQDGSPVWTNRVAAAGAEIRGDWVVAWDGAGNTIAVEAATGVERGRWPVGGADWVPRAPPRTIWTAAGPFGMAAEPASGCRAQLAVATVSDSGRLAAFCDDGTLLLGTTADPVRRRVPTEAFGDHVAMSASWTPDGRVIAGTLRGRVLVFDGQTGAALASLATDFGLIDALRVSPDASPTAGHAAIGGSLGGVGLLRLDTYTLVGELPAAPGRAFTFVPEGVRVHEADRIRTWRLPDGAPSVQRGTAGLADVAGSPDGALVATAGGDGGVVTVSLDDGRATRVDLGERVVKSVMFDPRGAGLVAVGMAPPFLAVRAPGAREWRALRGARPLRRVAWLSDGSIVGIDMDAGLYRWSDLEAEPEVLAPDRCFADLERDGDLLVLLDSDGGVDRLAGTVFTGRTTYPGARAVSLRGGRLAVATPDALQLIDAAGERRVPVPGPPLVDVAFSADGARVAAGSVDGTVYVWDASSGALLGQLPGHTERVTGVEFLPDGDLVTTSWDKSLRVWDLGALGRPVADLAAEVEASWGPGRRGSAR